MRILGLDLSITSPGFCVMDIDDNYEIVEINLHGFTKTDKWIFEGEGLIIHKFPSDYDKHPPHYRPFLVYDMVKPYLKDIDYIAVEDYAFGAKGKVFDIAECSGALKNIFYTQNIPMKKFPPMTVKTCATGNGGADKVLMGLAFASSGLKKFVNSFLFDLPEYNNPQEDLIDSIWMANTLRIELCYRDTGKFPENLYMPEANCQSAIISGKKGAKTKPSIEHPIITFGGFSRIKKEKKVKKLKGVEPPVEKKQRKPKKVMEVPSAK